MLKYQIEKKKRRKKSNSKCNVMNESYIIIIFDWAVVHFSKIRKHMKNLYLLIHGMLAYDRFGGQLHPMESVNLMLSPHQMLIPNPDKSKCEQIELVSLKTTI